MSELLSGLWQVNIEVSLLLAIILFARYIIRKTTKIYNAYLLWLSIPAGLLVAKLVAQIDFSQPPTETVSHIVQSYIVKPAATFDGWLYLGLLWATVTGLLLLRLLGQHIQLRRNLARIKVNVAFNFSSKYPLIGIDQEDFSPAVYGFCVPKIYFPIQLQNQLSQEQIALIIQHEEHHIKQQHLWLNLFWDMLVCCMWFNPLVYISRQNFRHDQELFCDYLVLNKSTKQDHKSYGHALLATVSATHSVSLLCSWKSFNQLEERIMNIKKSSSISSKIAIAIGGLAIIGCTSIYTVSAAQVSDAQVPDLLVSDKESFHHVVADDGSNQITWVKDGKTYVDENGKRYIVEGANKRKMSKAERKKFVHAIQNSRIESKASQRAQKTIEIEMRRARKDMQRHAEQLDIQERALEIQEQQMGRHQEEMENAERDIEKALKEFDQAHRDGEISEQQTRQTRDSLSRAKREISRDKRNLMRDTQRAKADIKRARAHLQQALAQMKVPTPPKAPVAPKAPIAPIAPDNQISEISKPVDTAAPLDIPQETSQ